MKLRNEFVIGFKIGMLVVCLLIAVSRRIKDHRSSAGYFVTFSLDDE